MFSYPHKSKTALAINKGRFLVPLLFKAITISVYSLNHIGAVDKVVSEKQQ